MSKKKLLIWCDSPTVPTGFGTVARNLFSELHKTYDVAIIGINEWGIRRYDHSKYHIYNVERTDPLGINRFSKILKDFEPEMVILFQDIFNIEHVLPIIKAWDKKMPMLFYFPIDGSPINQAWKGILKTPAKLVTYTKWAVATIKRDLPEVATVPIDYLYHGVNTDVYKPLSTDIIDKFRAERKWDDKFISICVNRFQPRKMLALTIRAQALFTKGYKVCSCGNVYLADKATCDLNGCDSSSVVSTHAGHSDCLLYLHTNANESAMGPGGANSLQAHMFNNGFTAADVNKTITAFGGNIYDNPAPEEVMNILYNIADVNVTTTLGEGIGLSLIESAAAGTTSIAPRHSATPEMLGDTGHLIPNVTLINIALDNAHLRPVVSMKHYLAALEIEYQKWVANGRKKVINTKAIDYVKQNFVWDTIRTQFEGWVAECLK